MQMEVSRSSKVLNGVQFYWVAGGASMCAEPWVSTTAGVVLRVDSPGGDALASDLMWREIQQLAEKKPVVACMGDVAASGGYYMSMAAQVRSNQTC
jgi:ATP-dependent protease ClpP protease subunit